MELQELKQTYNDLSNQIKELKLKQDQIKLEYQHLFDTELKKKQELDRQWFIRNFDYIIRHKDYFFEKSPFCDIVIDFLPLYIYGGLAGGAGFNGSINRIFLKELIYLWNTTYNYEGHPLIGYQKAIHNGIRQWVTYVENGQEVRKQVTFDDKNMITSLKMASLSDTSYPTKWDDYKTIDILKKEV